MGYDVVEIKEGNIINDLGKPRIPGKEIKIALPTGMTVTGVQVLNTQSIDIRGLYNIFPAQPPKRIGDADDEFIKPDTKIYNSVEPFPSNVVEFVHQTDLAGQGIAVIHLFPVQYIPAEMKLTLNTTISFVIEGTYGYECGDYLPKGISENGRKTYEQMVKDMVINPADVQLQEPTIPAQSRGVDPALDYDYVIITSTTYDEYWQPLADWKTKKGMPATIVTTYWIYNSGGYSGDNQQKIRSFVIDAHANWGTPYFLMAGEHGTVPFEYRNYYENTPSDQYYSDYDDDWTHEVFVGRSTSEGQTEINTFINKVINYEKNPPLSDYILNVLLIGMDADDETEMELLKEAIDGYIPSQFSVNKVYDSHGGNHRTNVLNFLNAGQHLVNHADHGNWDRMGVGSSGVIYNSDVNALSNDGRPSIVTTLACLVNKMDYSSDCIAERFVIHNPNQAGVAFTGNTRNGLYYPGDDLPPYYLSSKLDYWWWISLFDGHYTLLGEVLAVCKQSFGTDPWNPNAGRHCVWEFNLLGDPAMPIWTDTPESFDVTHNATVPIGFETYNVHVESGASPVNLAYVCLWIPDEDIYATGYTDGNGDVTLTLDPYPTEVGKTVYVTVTKHDFWNNYLPYEGTATTNIAGYWLDLSDFPMYTADSPADEHSGAAVAQMTVNYMHWNSNTHPGGPPMTYTQSELYTYGDGFSGISPYFDMEAVWHCVQDYRPGSYSEYGYNFTKRHNADQFYMLKQICLWIDYPAGRKQYYPVHVPAIVPAYGTYENWMAVRGIHTDVEAYPLPDILNIYGFWVNDPLPGGIGANSYKTISDWNSTYYQAMTEGDYIGEYLGIFEPPESVEECDLILAEPTPRFTAEQKEQLKEITGSDEIPEYLEKWIVQAAIDGVTEELIPFDENFELVFNSTVPGKPMFIESKNGDDYFAVPFNLPLQPKASSKSGIIEKSKKTQDISKEKFAENTAVVILIDAEEGSFKEASWTTDGVKYLPISILEAEQIAIKTAAEVGLKIKKPHPELVHRTSTPYYPEWRVIIREEKIAIYISQDGTVTVEDLVIGPAGGPMSSGEGTTPFVYSLRAASPNPFANNTTVSYSIARPGKVSVNIYDISGRLIRTLINERKEAGVHSAKWNGKDNNNRTVAAGFYFLRLSAGDFVSVRKVVLVR